MSKILFCIVYDAGDLEHQFTVLREQLYQERIRQIETHLVDLKNGKSQEYLEPLKQLQDTMDRRVQVAGILRKYRMENVNHKFCAEEQGAHQNFEVCSFRTQSLSLNLFVFNF